MKRYFPGETVRVMSRDEVRGVDKWAIEEIGIPGVVLMENAGRSCAEFIEQKLSGVDGGGVCILCGVGNNGGDGYVIARHLFNEGHKAKVVLCGDNTKVTGDAKINLDILKKLGHKVHVINIESDGYLEQVRELAVEAELIVDCLFGTGLKGHVRGNYKSLIESINDLDKDIVAVDIPSGLDCDSGEVLGACIRAKYTVSFVAVKKGFKVGKSAEQYTGEIYVADIGVIKKDS